MAYDPTRLSADNAIPGIEYATVGDYWAWAYSDVLENIQRGIYAEFLVASALGVATGARVGWLGYDLKYKDRIVEVKSCAYLQSWPQKKLSPIQWSVSRRIQWDPSGGPVPKEPVYVADCFVLSYYCETALNQVNVLNANDWRFFVLTTAQLEQLLGQRKKLRLRQVRDAHNETTYPRLRAEIHRVLGL